MDNIATVKNWNVATKIWVTLLQLKTEMLPLKYGQHCYS